MDNSQTEQKKKKTKNRQTDGHADAYDRRKAVDFGGLVAATWMVERRTDGWIICLLIFSVVVAVVSPYPTLPYYSFIYTA